MKLLTRLFMSAVGLSALSFSAEAQVAPATLLGAPDTVYVDMDTLGAAGVVAVYWDVLNETEETLDLMVTRAFVDTVSPFNYPYETDENGIPLAGSYERFCWGQSCFNFGTDASPSNPAFLVSLEPGDTTDTFVSDFYPNGVTGTTTLSYCFHQSGPPSLGACHNITFVVTGTVDAVTSMDIAPTGITAMSPNPTDGMVSIRLESARDGMLEFRNLVGQVCHTERVQAGVEMQRVDLNSLAEGIWLVSYKVEGLAVSTKRLVIH